MGAAVDDVHERHGQHLGVHAAKVVIERQAEKVRRGAGDGHGDAEHGVGAQARFVVGAVKVDEGGVDLYLAQGVLADDVLRDVAEHVVHGLGNAFPLVAFGIAVAQLKGLARTRGCAGGHGSASGMSGFEGHFHFHSGVSA